tara:strand:- start:279 stop:383 length:105 start_codon:yes stop_codon:yes gene_type:complete
MLKFTIFDVATTILAIGVFGPMWWEGIQVMLAWM